MVWFVQLDQHAICVVSSQLGTNGCREVVWLVVKSSGDSLFSAWAACFIQGLPRSSPEYILGTKLGKRLLVPVGPWQMATAPRWCITSDNGHCQVRQSCRRSMLAAEFSGLSWMIKLCWAAVLCYRKASCAMFSHRNVQLHGRALQVKDLRSLLCCRDVKMQMTGLTSCCRKRTYGPPLQPGELSQRRFQTFRKERRRLQAKHLWMEVRLSWHVLAGRMYTPAPTGKSREQLYALLFGKTSRGSQKNPMKKKPIVDLHSKQSRHGGSNAKSGCNPSKVKVHHWSRTCRACYRFSGARRKLLVLR